MFKLSMTREEVEELKSKIFLSEIQERILEYRLRDYSLTKMAILEHCSESTISKELNKLKKKIMKVL